MAGELAHPRRGGNQDGAVRAALASIRRTTYWYNSTGMPGPHPLLDGHRSGDEAPRVPALLQWSSRPCGPGGAHAGTEHGGRRRQGECPVVSLAVPLPWALSNADGGVRRVHDANDRHPSSFECPCGTNESSPPGEVQEMQGTAG